MKDFKSALGEIHINQAEIARRLHLTPQAVGKSSNPTLSRVAGICRVTGYSFELSADGNMSFQSTPRPENCSQEQDAILATYDKLSQSIRAIEIIRDYGTGISRETEIILIDLNKIWSHIRNTPFFWEPEV